MFSITGSTMKQATSPPCRTRSSSVGVVERDDDRVAEDGARDAGGRGDGPRRVRRAGLRDRRLHRDHHLVVVAVVATLDLHQLVPARHAPRHADGVHRRLRARVGEAPHRQAVALGQQLGHVGVGLAGGHEQRAVVELLLDRGPDLRMAVTGEQRPIAHVEVDVVVAVHVLQPGGLSPLGHDRVRLVEPGTTTVRRGAGCAGRARWPPASGACAPGT